MNVVVVVSPAKAKTINKYLGRDYKVVASYGHVRDLPSKDGSVLPDSDFAMSWQVDGKSEKHMKEIVAAMHAKTGRSRSIASPRPASASPHGCRISTASGSTASI